MTYTVIGVYEDNLQGGCFHVEAKNSPEAVAAVERRDTPETAHIAHDFDPSRRTVQRVQRARRITPGRATRPGRRQASPGPAWSRPREPVPDTPPPNNIRRPRAKTPRPLPFD